MQCASKCALVYTGGTVQGNGVVLRKVCLRSKYSVKVYELG